MRRAKSTSVAISLLIIALPTFSNFNAVASAPTIYEAISGTDGNSVSGSGSAGSVGFTGNWAMVNANKNPGPMTGVASMYRNSYNTKLKFPSNSIYSLPGSNTAAGTTSDIWNLYYSARQMSSGINFDSNGTFYLSFLGYSPIVSGSWGSYVVGLLEGMPTGIYDSTKKSIYVGRSYSGAPTIQITSANVAVWNPNTYSATGTANNPAAPDGNSWFIVAKFSTVASGNDSVKVKFFASTDSVPSTDSGISWDVSYSGAITGTYSYLGVQTEYNAVVDEIRGGLAYDSVSGLASAPSIGAPSVAATPLKGINLNLTVSVNASGFFRFYVDGKRISGCLKVTTSGSSPSFTATCSWKPSVKGTHLITADFTSADSNYLSGSSPTSIFFVSQRTNSR